MDEAGWLDCDDLKELWWCACRRARPSERKVRLFACAGCRLVWHQLKDERSRRAVEALEEATEVPGHSRDLDAEDASARAAMREVTRAIDPLKWKVEWAGTQPERMRWAETEGVSLVAEAEAAYEAASVAVVGINMRNGDWVSGDSLLHYVEQAARKEAEAKALGPARESISVQAGAAARRRLLSHFRDVFGNPFLPVALDPAWRTTTVRALAQAAYENRQLPSGTLDAQRLAVLADCLEESGCTDAEILGHLRGPGPHVRGCFLIDAILDKSEWRRCHPSPSSPSGPAPRRSRRTRASSS